MYQKEISFRTECEIKTFSDEEKQRKLIIGRCILKEILNEAYQVEENFRQKEFQK